MEGPLKPRRGRGRPHKEHRKPRDTRTVRLSLRLLQKVKDYQKKQRAAFGRTRSISDILLADCMFFDQSVIEPLSAEHSQIVSTIVSFLVEPKGPNRRVILQLLEATVTLIRSKPKNNAPGV